MHFFLTKNCTHSKLIVSPKNWESKRVNIVKPWRITYRFYDPRFTKPKLIVLKGMNAFKNVQERQLQTVLIIEKEIKLLKDGYNPFDKILIQKLGFDFDNLTFLDALNLAKSRAIVSQSTISSINYTINKVERTLKKLNWTYLSVKEISRKHIKTILDESSISADSFNKSRSYLMILFSILCELEIIPINVIRDIKKRKVVKRIRQVLTNEERVVVNKYLQENYPEFHRFLNIFFHSGSRTTELLRVKVSDVDFEKQRFKVLIQKGYEFKEVWKVIKDIALPFWEQLLINTPKDYFVFSKGLNPGLHQIKAFQINKRWYRLVKKKLNITADFYSLKHLHTTEVVDLIGEMEAAKHNSHTSVSMVKSIYDVKNKSRVNNKIISLQNKFA